MKLSSFILVLISINTLAQKQEAVRIDSLPTQGILLNKGWKWYAGDKPEYAKPEFDDSAWESIDPTLEIPKLPQINTDKPLWLRLNISSKNDNTLLASVVQSGATEIFLNGKLISTYGQIENTSKSTVAYDPLNDAFILHLDSNSNTLAIRYYFQKNINYNSVYNINFPLFSLQINNRNYPTNIYLYFWSGFNVAVPFLLFIVHFIFFWFYTPNRTNFWYSLASFWGFIGSFLLFKMNLTHSLESKNYFSTYASIPLLFSNILVYYTIYLFLKQRKIWMVISFAGLSILALSLNYFDYFQSSVFLNYLITVMYVITVVYMGNHAWKQGEKGGLYLIFGMIAYIIFWTLFILSFNLGWGSMSGDILFHIATIIFPIIVSVLLGLEFKNINNSLIQNLQEVNKLASEKQQILAAQNETLEKQVSDRTSELVHKNRDLEIEAALDKIRSSSLAMYHSDEIESVVSVLFEKLKELGLVFDGGAAIHVFSEGSKDAAIWVVSPQQPPTKINLPYDEGAFLNNPIIYDVWKAKETGEHIFNKIYSFEEKNKYFYYVFKHNDYIKIPEMGRNFILNAPNYTASFVAEKNSLLGANSWTGQLFSEADFAILKRVARVFEQAYTRFLDLQKAEAQAREGEIELALERVRNRTMAMQHSEELSQAANLLSNEVRKLGIPIWSCGYNIMDKDEKACLGWMSTEGSIQPSFRIPLKVSPTFIKFYESRQNGVELFEEQIGGTDLETHYNYMFTLPDFAEIIKGFINSGHQLPTFQVNTVVNFAQGNLIFISAESVPEAWDIFKRFAKVFEQTYTRFLDLQKAEAQTREAQIEVALERVRSKTMAMQSSDELSTIIGLIYNEMVTLNVQLQRCFFMIFNPQNLGVTWWMASGESIDLGQGYFVPYSEHSPQLAYLKGWQECKERWQYHMKGEEKVSWDAYLFQETDLKNLPSFIINNMKSEKSVYLVASFNTFGCLTTGNEQPLSKEAFDLLIRFSKVFDLTYTRFNDIMIAEAQAEQARLDLIQIQTEKKRAEDALTVLKSTQTQLIQSEKMASLGELTAGIAHEIQNPLNFVNNFSEVSEELIEELKSPLTPEGGIREGEKVDMELFDDVVQNLRKISLHGKRASSIVKGMLEHSRTSSGKKELTDLNALADEYLRLAYHGLRAKDSTFNADFKTDFDNHLPQIEVIPQDIGRVLLNLINNAFQAVDEASKGSVSQDYKPTVKISTRYLAPSPPERAGGEVELRLKDNGPGIPDAIKDKIFQPFFTTKDTGKGTGLGLSLAYDIVKAHGGDLKVESKEGEGSTFIIQLPII